MAAAGLCGTDLRDLVGRETRRVSAHHGARARRPRRGDRVRRDPCRARAIRSSSSPTIRAAIVHSAAKAIAICARRGPRSASTPDGGFAELVRVPARCCWRARRAPPPTRCCSPSRSPWWSGRWGAASRQPRRDRGDRRGGHPRAPGPSGASRARREGDGHEPLAAAVRSGQPARRRRDACHASTARSPTPRAGLPGARAWICVVETAGTAEAVTHALELVRPGGRVVLTGLPHEPTSVSFFSVVRARNHPDRLDDLPGRVSRSAAARRQRRGAERRR